MAVSKLTSNYFSILFLIFLFLFAGFIYGKDFEFYNPQDLKRGMKGYALTVFQGDDPEKVDLEVIEYMPHTRVEGAILIRLFGEKIEHTQVAQGMSGSPVYIDGKLVGAIAYTYRYSKDVIGGVTPIHCMVNEKNRVKSTGFLPKDSSPVQLLWAVEGLDSDSVAQRLNNIDQKDRYRKVDEFVQKVSSKVQGKSPLNPGDSVAIKLVDGDVRLAGIGTVTHVSGEDVYIFGHTMDHLGATSLPLSRAYIYHVLASNALSFKIGVALPGIIGSTVFDGQFAVYGRFDYEAQMIPARFSIRSPEYNKVYNLNFARSAYYLPTMISYVFAKLAQVEMGKNIQKKIMLSWKLDLPGGKTVKNSTAWVFDPENDIVLEDALEQFWYHYISVLWKNPVVQIVPENIMFAIDIEDTPYNYYMILGSRVMSNRIFRPGEKIDLEIKLKEYRGDIHYHKVSLTIPKKTRPGSYKVILGADFYLREELSQLFPEFYSVRTASQLLKELNIPVNLQRLTIAFISSSKASLIGDNVLGNVPNSRQSAFESTLRGRSIESPNLIEYTEILDSPIFGTDSLSITVGELR